MPNVTVYLIGALVVAVLVSGAGYKGYQIGGDHVRSEYAARDLANANEQAAKTKEIEERYRAKEQAHAQALAQVSTDYQRKLTDAQGKTTVALNAIRSGSLRLRLTDANPEACGSKLPETTASSARSDGAGEGRFLGDADSTFLATQASRCDAIVLKLNAVQDAVEAERR